MKVVLKISRIAAAVAVSIVLSLLAWQCLDIYQVGSSPANLDEHGLYIRPVYIREDVSARLDSLSFPLAACAGIVIFSLFLHAAAAPQSKDYAGMTPEHRLQLIKGRISGLSEAAQKEERLRKGITLAFGAAIAGLLLYCLCYLLDSSSFPAWETVALDTAMGNLLLHILPASLCALGLGIALSCIRRASIQRELVLLQKLPKTEPAPLQKDSPNTTRVRVALYVLAIGFIVLGVINGGLRDVLYKAINICTECIGLG